MRYEKQYTDKDFIGALSEKEPHTAGFVAKQVGCTLPTSKTALKSLAERGLIIHISIDEGASHAYKLKRQTKKGDNND